jgi:hypothetical protein
MSARSALETALRVDSSLSGNMCPYLLSVVVAFA